MQKDLNIVVDTTPSQDTSKSRILAYTNARVITHEEILLVSGARPKGGSGNACVETSVTTSGHYDTRGDVNYDW